MITIHLLRDKPEFIDKVSEVNFNTWIDFYADNNYEHITCVQEYKEDLIENYMDSNKIPIMIVADADDKYVGNISLIDDDFPEIARDRVWITELYVLPEYRNKGVAKLLIQKALDTARSCGLQEVYLSCLEDLVCYYKKLDFISTGEEIFFANKKYYVFKYNLVINN